MFLSCRRSPLLLSSTILRRTHLWLPYPQHMLFFLYWSVSLFCILNLSAPSNPISNVYSGLTWGKVEGVRVLSEGWSVTKTRCYGINWITFPLTVPFSSSFQRSHLIMTFSSVLYLFFVCHAGTATLMCACVYTHTLLVSGYWLPGWVQESPLCGVVVDDSENNGADIQMSIQLCQQRVTFVWRTRVPNCTLLILNLYLHNSVDE